MRNRRWSNLGLALLLTMAVLFTSAGTAFALEPTAEFYVNDYVGVLSSRDADYLIQRGRNLHAQNGVQVVVVIVDNYIGETMDAYANKVFNDFGIGAEDYDTGILLIVAVDDGDVRIELGDGVTGQISDSKAGKILDDYFLPDAEEGDLASAIYRTYVQLIQEGSRLDTPGGSDGDGSSGSLIASIIGIICLVVAIAAIILALRRLARRRPPTPPYGSPGQGYTLGTPSGGPAHPTQTSGPTAGPFYPYGGAPDYRLPRRVFFPSGGGIWTFPSGQSSGGSQSGNQPDQSNQQQRPRASGGGGSSSGGGAKRVFPSSSSGRTSTPRSRSPFSGSSRPSGGFFGGGGRSIGGGGGRSFGGGGKSFGGGAGRSFKR